MERVSRAAAGRVVRRSYKVVVAVAVCSSGNDDPYKLGSGWAQMTIADAIIVGALCAMLLSVVAALAAWTAYKAWVVLRQLSAATAELSLSNKTMLVDVKKATAAMIVIGTELAYMRSMTQQASGQDQGGDVYAPPMTVGPTSRPKFPKTIYDRFPVEEPDAKPEDTDMEGLTQTDDDLVAQEQLEILRQRGIDVDSEPEGVFVESE